jgi:hypothetical protein
MRACQSNSGRLRMARYILSQAAAYATTRAHDLEAARLNPRGDKAGLAASWKTLAVERIKDLSPTIPPFARGRCSAQAMAGRPFAAIARSLSTPPNSLWSSVVELLTEDQREYLEHCRKYARENS